MVLRYRRQGSVVGGGDDEEGKDEEVKDEEGEEEEGEEEKESDRRSGVEELEYAPPGGKVAARRGTDTDEDEDED